MIREDNDNTIWVIPITFFLTKSEEIFIALNLVLNDFSFVYNGFLEKFIIEIRYWGGLSLYFFAHNKDIYLIILVGYAG